MTAIRDDLDRLFGVDPDTSAVSCEVWVDGTRLADTGADYAASTPTALAGLQLTWGRASIVDQPDTSSVSLTVADKDSDGDYLTRLHVGSTLDVYAAGDTTTGTDPVDITTDGGFELTPLNNRARITAGVGALSFTTDAFAGRQSLRTRNGASGSNPQVSIPPAPFSTAINAWDLIPSVTAGETWTVEFQYRLGVAGRVQCWGGVAIYTTPTGPGQSWTTSNQLPDGSGWLHYSETVTIPSDAPYGWLGARLAPVYARWSSPVTTGTWAAAPGAWEAWGRVDIDELHVWGPPEAALRVLVFTGRVTDLHATRTAERVEVSLTASDWTIDLSNDEIGDNPWPAQTIKTRAARVAQLTQLPFTIQIDSYPGARTVTWVDIDAQPALAILTDLATSADALLWSAFHETKGFYLWMEDPATRQSLAVFADNGSGTIIITGNTRPANGVVISACDVIEDGVAFTQDVTDVLTRIDLTWQEQTLDGDGLPAPTERHIVIDDANAQASWGIRRLGYSTQLTTAADGQAIAQRVLDRSRALGWKASGIVWDTRLPVDGWSDSLRTGLMHLLDGTRRIGCALVITDLPAWSPTTEPQLAAYVEGGTYEFSDGRWKLSLNVSPAGMTGHSATWREMNAVWAWRQYDTHIRWQDCWGVQGQ